MATRIQAWKLITLISTAQVLAMGLMIAAAAAVTPGEKPADLAELKHSHGAACEPDQRQAWIELGLFSR